MTDAEPPAVPLGAGLTRMTTGSAELDLILGGGLPVNSINIMMGEPGSGKTILAEAMAFANAEPGGRPILYFTTLSEPLEKVVRYLQEFDFYDQEVLTSGAIIYDSIGPELEQQGIAAVVPRLKHAIKTLSPKLIIIDSFKAINDLSTSINEMRRMLYEMGGLLTAYETTALLVGEYRADQVSVLPEFAVADATIELARRAQGTRDERYLRVLKLRGSRYREGLHAFRIGRCGLEVFPRLTSPPEPPPFDASSDERLTTGVPGLDELMQGGYLVGTTTLAQGPTGSGKTTLALQFVLAGLARGEPGLYVNFQENPSQLARSIRSLGWSLDEARARGLELIYTSPVELDVDRIVVGLAHTVDTKHIRRIGLDALGELTHNSQGDLQRVLGYIYALQQHFQVKRATSVMTYETAMKHETGFFGQVSAMTDNILNLGFERHGDSTHRTLQVLKARGTEHTLDIRALHIDAKGARVD